MTNKSPAFQFYPRDWLTDPCLMLLDWECRGMHLHLLCVAWFQDPPGTLPNDNLLLMKFLGIPASKNTSITKFEMKLKSQILVNFILDEDPSSSTRDRWVHAGLVEKFQAQKSYKESRSKNANKRWNKKHMDSTCESEEEHMQCSASATSSSSAVDKDIKNISLSKQRASAIKDDIPEWLNQEDWISFLEHRKALRAPINTLKQRQAIFARLKELKDQGHDASTVINTAIVNGWRGLFPIQNDNKGRSTNGARKETNSELHFRLATEGIHSSKRCEEREHNVFQGGENSQAFLEVSGDVFAEMDITDKH